MKMQAKRSHPLMLLFGLALLSPPVLALEINNNTGYLLKVKVECGNQKDSFDVSPNQVGSCPSNVCGFNTTCNYKIRATDDGSCSGRINGGSGLQVEDSNNKLRCLDYGG